MSPKKCAPRVPHLMRLRPAAILSAFPGSFNVVEYTLRPVLDVKARDARLVGENTPDYFLWSDRPRNLGAYIRKKNEAKRKGRDICGSAYTICKR